MSDHVWAQENLDAYLAGGLTLEERERFAEHVSACEWCTFAINEARQVDSIMDELFVSGRPDVSLEERMIQELRKDPPARPRRGSKFVRVLAGIAAVLLLGGLGAGLQALAFWDENWAPLGTIRVAKQGWDPGESTSANNLEQLLSDEKREPFTAVDVDPALQKNDVDLVYKGNRIEDIGIPGSVNPDKAVGIMDGPKQAPPVRLPAPGDFNAVQGLAFGNSEGKPAPLSVPEEDLTPGEASKVKQRLTGDKESLGFFAPPAALKFRYALTAPTSPVAVAFEPPRPPADQLPIRVPLPQSPVILGGEKKGAETVEQKIIRTGDLEFEVDAFDAAVETISKLIAKIDGAIRVTVNSEKLSNGKVRGWVVVRVPPASLDKFLADLRTDLGKSAELKSQKLGSEDVTKQYIDLESRLRNAKAMEVRWLEMLKNPRGEIKDLIAIERELNVTRGKIEEMQGELKYYQTQIALSKLTLHLTEKEIQAPSSVVVSETVRMRLEVEDVEKARLSALAAVTAVKGRVTKADVKQQSIGKYEAIIHAEVPQVSEETLRESLKKLGVVRYQDAQRTQQTEGGSGKPLDSKTRYADVQFDIALYNTANIQPRETFDMKIATLDVTASYRKLQEAVAQAKGQVLTGKLNEQDKLNISAHFDFDIATSAKSAIDKLIAEIGPIFSRGNAQVPMSEIATDRQVGYRLVLRNVASIPAREKVTLTVEVKDLDRKAVELTELVRANKGLVLASKVDHQSNGQATATLVFDVPLSAQETLVRQFKEAGKPRLQQTTRNPQVPDNELATARIELTLTSVAWIVPSDERGLWPSIRRGLSYSFVFFSWAIIFIITGVSVVLPCTLVLWVGSKVIAKLRKKPQTA